jgi:hypothetical protein
MSHLPPNVPPPPPQAPTPPDGSKSLWTRVIAFLRSHPTRRSGVNWAIWAVGALIAIGIIGSVTTTPAAKSGTGTASTSVVESPSPTEPTTSVASSPSSHPAPPAITTPASGRSTTPPAPRPTTTAVPRPPATTAAPLPPRTTAAPRPPAPRVSPLTCVASMSNPNPADYTTTDVIVRTGVSGATVTATAHYKTKDTTHSGIAASNGVADIAFNISGATPGYTVTVDVTVTAQGASKYCSTAFTPHR